MALLDTIDTILLGRVTYQMFAGYFPLVTEGDDKPFADKLNGIPKIVFSQTLAQAPWGKWDDATIVRGSPTQEGTALKQQSGKAIVVWGSISVAQSLINEGLIDEYRLVVCPVVLGSGRPLFRDKADALDMTLWETKAHDRGSVLLRYIKSTATSAPAPPVLETASVR